MGTENEKIELIKAPVVIGENVIQKMITNNIELEKEAKRLKNCKVIINNLKTDVFKDKVLIHGAIKRHIYYVGTDDLIHYQTGTEEFSEFISIPGVESGMKVMVDPQTEHIKSILLTDQNMVEQKTILHFFIKVLSMKELLVETGDGPLIKVDRVVGGNTVQIPDKNEVILADNLMTIDEVEAGIKNLQYELIDDRVLVQGLIHRDIYYIDKEGIKHNQSEDIPFNESINMPGSKSGMDVEVFANIKNLKHDINQENNKIIQRFVIKLSASVTETVQLNLVTGGDSLVMLPEVVGENTKELMKESSINIKLPVSIISEVKTEIAEISGVVVNNKVIIQGIINEQIFYIGEDKLEHSQEENLGFSTYLGVAGARPGMKVELIGDTPDIKNEMVDGQKLSQKIFLDLFVKVSENIQFNLSESEYDNEKARF